MTTDIMAIIFADFNEPTIAPIEVVAEEVPAPIGDISEIRQEAWTDGYLRGRLEHGSQSGDANLTARLLTSVHELDAKALQAVDAASLAVADMLVSSFIAATSDDWPMRLLDRVRMVADRIKPAMSVAPQFVLRDDSGAIRHFGDLTELSRALETGHTGADVTIQWQRGEATISRSSLLEDLRQAIIPLSAGLANEQNAGNQT